MVVAGSKTLKVGESLVNIRTAHNNQSDPIITSWTERHSYQDKDGVHLPQEMVPQTAETFPPQSEHFRTRLSDNSLWFRPKQSLSGIGRITSLWINNIVANSFTNREVDRVLETDSAQILPWKLECLEKLHLFLC